MSEQIIKSDSNKPVSVDRYRKITGLSCEAVNHLIQTNQVKFIELPGGGYKIYPPTDDPDIVELNKRLERIENKFDRVLTLFNMVPVK